MAAITNRKHNGSSRISPKHAKMTRLSIADKLLDRDNVFGELQVSAATEAILYSFDVVRGVRLHFHPSPHLTIIVKKRLSREERREILARLGEEPEDKSRIAFEVDASEDSTELQRSP